MVPVYQDISHFRAPYKNMWASMGADEPAVPGADNLAALVFEKKDGLNYFKPEVKAQVLASLENLKYVFMGGPVEWVKLEPYGPGEIVSGAKTQNAARWVEEKVKNGQTVLAPVWVLAPSTDPMLFLMAPKANDDAGVKMGMAPYGGAGGPYVGILSGSTGLFASLSTTTKVLIGAAAVVGVGALIMAKRRGRISVPKFG